MQAGNTCRRCVRNVGSGLRRNLTAEQFCLRSHPSRCFASSTYHQHLHDPSSNPSNRPLSQLKNTRASSTLGQTTRDEPGEAQTLPGLSQRSVLEPRVNPLLRPNNLFHPFSQSPSPEIRKRAAFIKQHAYCPHPSHRQTRIVESPNDPEARKTGSQPPVHVSFECPDCGIPVYCSEEHWADDYENHIEICDRLREINEDDHDLRSGRFFPEFEYPEEQIYESMINMTNWDTFLYTRDFKAINDTRSMRQVTRMLTYPVTIGSVLHELSPYNLRNRLTTEGLKSLSALRYTLHPPKTGAGPGIRGLRIASPPSRLFILGARAESSLPRNIWTQLNYMFGDTTFHLIFIGPEAMANRDAEWPLPERTASNPFGAIVEDRVHPHMKISTYVDYYHTLHEAKVFEPFDPYFDAFILFHPGLGHPASAHEWSATIPNLLETKIPIICTGYTEWDMKRDWQWVQEKVGGEVDMLLEPGENRFRSLRWEINDLDPGDVSAGNWGVWAFRGKRYETMRKDAE
ncbi:MAG: translational activator for mitochondrial COX1 [Cirrosporium novae-zelandiae]|nr:MAG: translational activator for mitochondrial COX1 [Cirrosporium novae-zelandiae]